MLLSLYERLSKLWDITTALPEYQFPSPSKEPLEFADLSVIDLSQAETTEGRLELAKQVCKAMKDVGFFYVINHGYTPEQTSHIFGIADMTFDKVSTEEKQLYTGKSPTAYEGYKPRGEWRLSNNVFDQIEHYNIHRHVKETALPQAIRPFLNTLDGFARYCHFNVVHPILRLLAVGLELPEETLVNQHSFEAEGHSSVRFMKYFPRTAAEEAETMNVWLKGHKDFGSITVLWSQPVGGLQILSPDGKWRYVKHIDNAIVINAGDAIEFLCGGYYPATRHRVVQPPADQAGLQRLGVFYFSMADDNVKLRPHTESPVLQRVGIHRLCEDDEAPTMKTWRMERTNAYGKSALKRNDVENVEEEVISGVLVQHYN